MTPDHLSACPQISVSRSFFCSTTKHMRTQRILDTSKKRNSQCSTDTWEQITVGLYHCGDKQCQRLVLHWFGSFGCSGKARLDDLHVVVASYRPSLKAQAVLDEKQSEELGGRLVVLQHMSHSWWPSLHLTVKSWNKWILKLGFSPQNTRYSTYIKTFHNNQFPAKRAICRKGHALSWIP